MGTQGPSVGHWENKQRALIAHIVGIECPKYRTIFGHFSQVGGFDIMHDALWRFCDGFMMVWWYFYGNFMILLSHSWYFDDTFCKVIRKVSFSYIIIYQLFIPLLNPKDDTLRLFHKKNFFRVRINSTLNLKRIWYNTL